MLISPAYAQAAAGGAGGILPQLLPFVLIFVVFYFLLIRPQQKRAKAHRLLVAGLQRGNHVLTAGGITGRIMRAVDGSDTVEVEIAQGVVVEIMRTMISEVRNKDGSVMVADPKAGKMDKGKMAKDKMANAPQADMKPAKRAKKASKKAAKRAPKAK